jgi:hypothetical protein
MLDGLIRSQKTKSRQLQNMNCAKLPAVVRRSIGRLSKSAGGYGMAKLKETGLLTWSPM